MRARAIIFDMDDTLYAEEDYIRSGYRAIAVRLAVNGISPQKIFDLLWDIFSHDPQEKVFNVVMAKLNIPETPELVNELITLYREHKPDIAPTEGVIELLEYLSGKYRLGLISDGYLPGQHNKLEALGIRKYFDEVIFTESLGREFWKPSARAFEIIADKLGVAHSECVYIGDNEKKDFIGPNALGWQTICLKATFQVHSHKTAPPDGLPQQYIDNLQKLYQLF